MKKLRLLPDERCTTELHTLSPFIVLERGKYKIHRSKKQFTEGRSFFFLRYVICDIRQKKKYCSADRRNADSAVLKRGAILAGTFCSGIV
ncbi:unnamed protein product [Gongylonema pulchrum]|uniref:AraC family transcriptional regulator n=1 Tax=Gongylonema pulchrum TaxID=637853 RepID=A0A183DZH1_9BILA|nr:unnamed protein product [Gongylonema pulchrum]